MEINCDIILFIQFCNDGKIKSGNNHSSKDFHGEKREFKPKSPDQQCYH